jgi:DNA-binding MarR family transcriptional regulator
LLQRRLDDAELSDDLKPGMGSLLFALFREDNRSITDVADELRVAKSTMTGMVARMRDAGLVRVESDDSDGRACRLCLTPQGRKLEPKCRKLAVEMESLLGSNLTRTELEAFRRSLQIVMQTIAGELSKVEEGPKPGGASRSKKRAKQ